MIELEATKFRGLSIMAAVVRLQDKEYITPHIINIPEKGYNYLAMCQEHENWEITGEHVTGVLAYFEDEGLVESNDIEKLRVLIHSELGLIKTRTPLLKRTWRLLCALFRNKPR